MEFLVVLPGKVLLEALSNVFWSGHSCYVRGHWGFSEVELKKMEERKTRK